MPVSAAALARARESAQRLSPTQLLEIVAEYTSPGPTRDGLASAARLDPRTPPEDAARLLRNGSQVVSADTVPFDPWCAARHLDDFAEALWATVSGLGDRDTTCAIAGGVVALRVGEEGIPAEFRSAREPLGM